jgi:hypothetical protein
MTYHPDKLSVAGLLSSFYLVPEFQRRYAWSKEEIVELVNDLFGDTDWTADSSYFLGSIVTVRPLEDSKRPFLLIDGQQRITTLSLIVSVLLKEVATERDLNGATKAAFLVQNQDRLYELRPTAKGGSERRFRVQLQPADAAVFERLVTEAEALYDVELQSHSITKAAQLVEQALKQSIDANKRLRESSHPYYDMLYFVTSNVEVVRINADTESDAFRLFEALNDRGLRLSAADLVKNKLLARASKADAPAILEHWERVVSSTGGEIIPFLRSAWIANFEFVRKAELYNVYKSRIESLSSKQLLAFVAALEKMAVHYKDFTRPQPDGKKGGARSLQQSLRRLKEFGARTCRPAILAVRTFHSQNLKLQVQVAHLCESITVRYSLVGGRNPNALEKLYAAMAERLRKDTVTFDEILSMKDMEVIPSDDEFSAEFAGQYVGKGNSAWFTILECLNNQLSGGKSELDARGATGVHIEHILPQKPTLQVAETYGFGTLEDVRQWSGLIGNLTLLGEKRNKEASNREFAFKRKKYAKSDVVLTRRLARLEDWGFMQIKERSLELAELAVARFSIGAAK